MLKPYESSIGGWCLVSGESDPFGEATRSLPLEIELQGCSEAGIRYVGFHDPIIAKIRTELDTDSIKAHAYRLIQIVTGTQKTGSAVFTGTPWGEE